MSDFRREFGEFGKRLRLTHRDKAVVGCLLGGLGENRRRTVKICDANLIGLGFDTILGGFV